MSIASYIFYFFALLTIMFALFILFAKNVLHAVLSLLGVFLGMSAMYVFAGADFLAITQLVVYVGGVLVLLLFGVMLTNRESVLAFPVSGNKYLLPGILSGISILFVLLYLTIEKSTLFIKNIEVNKFENSNTIRLIGFNLMSEFLIVFELAGILLLVALIGAVFIAGKNKTGN